MRFDLANLPSNIDTLRGIIVTQAADFAAELGAREAELAAAKAGLVAKTLEIEKLKLQIARLRRAQFGRSSEKIARKIEQLELNAGRSGSGDVGPDGIGHLSRGRCRAIIIKQEVWAQAASRCICRAKRSCTNRAAPVHHAAARCAR